MVSCPFCKCKSDKLTSMCPHIIACFDRDGRDPVYVDPEIKLIIRREGFPLKCLRDFFKTYKDNNFKTLKDKDPELFKDNIFKIEDEEAELFHVRELFYVKERDIFLIKFRDYLIETSFLEIKLNLRNFYWVFSLLFEKLEKDDKISPVFQPPWFLNLDFDNLPNSFIKDCVREIMHRKIKNAYPEGHYLSKQENLQFIIDNFETNEDIKQEAKDLLHDIISGDEFLDNFDFSKWVLKYAKENYGFGKDFYLLFREIEVSGDVIEFLEMDLKDIYLLPIDLINALKPYENFKSFKFLEKFIKMSKHQYLDEFQKPGIFNGIRKFYEELIYIVSRKHNIRIHNRDNMGDKIKKLYENSIIDDALRSKLYYNWRQLSTIVHTFTIDEYLKDMQAFKNDLIEYIIPKFSKLIV